jgi:hypothetical protein
MAISANKQREKEILAFAKNQSKKSKWQFRGWQSFKIEGPFLLSVNFNVYGKLNKLNADLKFKFKDIDNLSCQIFGVNDYFKTGPLYYKVNSVGMIFPDTYFQFEITEVTEEKITNLIDEIDKKAIELVHQLSDSEKYYEFLKSNAEKRGTYADNMNPITLAYLEKYEELLAIIKFQREKDIKSRIAEGILNDPQFYENNFFDKLMDYVKRKQLMKYSSRN